MLSAEVKAELKATADALSAPGKGFLASDESAGPWLRAGHSEAKKMADTVENRAACASPSRLNSPWQCALHPLSL